MLENRGTMQRRERRIEASGATRPVGSSPRQTEFLPQKGGWPPKGAIELFIVHYSLFIAFLSIAENSRNFNPTLPHFCPRNPQKPANMIPVMVGFVPVKYRFSTGKVPVTVGYGRLRKLSGPFLARKTSYEVTSTTL
jgi:hypothetical protein